MDGRRPAGVGGPHRSAGVRRVGVAGDDGATPDPGRPVGPPWSWCRAGRRPWTARAASTRPAKSRTSPFSSGCHWTPTANVRPSTSTASTTPSSLRAETRSDSPGTSTAWWWLHSTTVSSPRSRWTMVDGSVRTVTSPKAPAAGWWRRRAQQVGQLLDQGPAEQDVEDLVTTADGEERQVPLEGRLDQAELRLVAEPAHAAVAAVGLLSVAFGRHVPTADDHQAVDGLDEGAGDGGDGAGRGRRPHPRPAGGGGPASPRRRRPCRGRRPAPARHPGPRTTTGSPGGRRSRRSGDGLRAAS